MKLRLKIWLYELLLWWRYPDMLSSVRRGLAQSLAGETRRSTEDFTQYVHENEDL